MNKSREYLKSLSVKERSDLAAKLNVRQEYLYQISAGIRNPSRELSIRLEIITRGAIKDSDFEEELRTLLTVRK